ncbi:MULTISPECIES: SRPBCC family protein [unclassified Streptomyces]|uniref:SRPBCC family protein n=1 Tax=unclassified Streptomyces TaxID=2593676 RepID=UPI0035DC26DA
MGSLTIHVSGPCAPDTAWARYAGIDEWASWAPHIKRVHADGRSLVTGLRGTVESVAHVAVPFQVQMVDHEQRVWTWQVRMGPVWVTLHHGVQAHGGGSRASLVMHGPTPVLAAYAPLARLALRRLVRR